MKVQEATWDDLKKQGSAHYKGGDVEPLDLYRAGGLLRHFAIANIIKYAYRQRQGVSAADCDKIVHYAQILKTSEVAAADQPVCISLRGGDEPPCLSLSPCAAQAEPPDGGKDAEDPFFRPQIDLKAEVVSQAADWIVDNG